MLSIKTRDETKYENSLTPSCITSGNLYYKSLKQAMSENGNFTKKGNRLIKIFLVCHILLSQMVPSKCFKFCNKVLNLEARRVLVSSKMYSHTNCRSTSF